jgi:hypothetical protein
MGLAARTFARSAAPISKMKLAAVKLAAAPPPPRPLQPPNGTSHHEHPLDSSPYADQIHDIFAFWALTHML